MNGRAPEPSGKRMTFTGAIGAACMLPLRAIINLCVALRIHPNTLTLVGVLVNVGAAWALGFGQFLGEQDRQPDPAQQLAHWRARTAFGQELVILCTEHDCPPGLLRPHTGRSPFTVTRVPARVCGQ